MPKGGYRPGSGRPKGSRDKASLLKDAALKDFRARVARHAQRLFNAQMSLAEGCSFLFRREGKGDKAKFVVVTSQSEIVKFLDGELDPDAYQYIHTERPNNLAISDLLDRGLGKPTTTIAIGEESWQPLFALPTSGVTVSPNKEG